MTTSTASPGDPIAGQADTCVPKGIVAGTVLRAARLSAGVTETVLACEAGLPEELIRAWEDGSLAFASASETEAKQLKDALYGARAQDQLAEPGAGSPAWAVLSAGRCGVPSSVGCTHTSRRAAPACPCKPAP